VSQPAQLPQGGNSIHLGHHDIEKNKLWPSPSRDLKGLSPAGGGKDLIASLPENHCQELANLRFVIDYKNRDGRFVSLEILHVPPPPSLD
jgi:hypothetical protein